MANKPDPNAKAPMCSICENKHWGVNHIWKKTPKPKVKK